MKIAGVFWKVTMNNDIEDFANGWHKQHTKEHICIWSDKWMELHRKQLENDYGLVYRPPNLPKNIPPPIHLTEVFHLDMRQKDDPSPDNP